MQRIAYLLPLGLTSGLLVGLIAGGLVLNLILGRDPNATGIFVLIAEFPGFARLTSVPWVGRSSAHRPCSSRLPLSL
jgi:type IV secretion system protein VirD4